MTQGMCATCGIQIPPDAKFCPACGTRIMPDQNLSSAQQIFCTNCGSENGAGNWFCSYCGTQLHQANISSKQKKVKFKIEPWHVVLTLVVIVIGVMVFYNVGSKEQSHMPQEKTTALAPTMENQMAQQFHNDLVSAQKEVFTQPKNPTVILHYANFLYDAQSYDSAIFYYTKYLGSVPKDVNVIVDRAICYYEKGESAKALEEMKRGLQIEPKHQMATFNIGIVYLSQKNIEEARHWFQKTCAIDDTTNVGKQAKMMLTQHTKNK